MARTRIGSKLIAVAGVHKDNIQSGSIEIKHLDFVGNVSGHLVDLNDADVIAVLDASGGGAPATRMKALKLSDLKNYISASAGVGGRTGSLQFAQKDGSNLKFAGILDITSDGTHLTASGGKRIYFTNAALGTSPKHQYIHGSAAGKLDIVADNTGSGEVILRAGKKVQLRTVANAGLAVGVISSTAVLMDGRDGGTTAHRANIRFNTNNSAPAVTIFSGSSAVFGTRNSNVQLQQNGGKLFFDNGTTYFAGSSTNVQYLTASAAKITSLEVDELVSRTTTKESLEIKDNLIIAGVSGSKHGNLIGGGFQLGGKVGVQGTGSSPLFSLTLGDISVGKGSLLLNVAGTRVASITSGSFYNAAGNVGNGILAVTGAVSASFARAQFVNAGTVTASAGTFQRVVTNKLTGDGIVTVDNIGTGSVGTPQLAALGVTTAKIAVGAVGIDQLATGSVFTPQLVTSAVTKAKIATGAVTLDKLATGSVSTPQLGAGVVTHAKLAVGAVTADNIQTGSVNTAHLAAVSVTHAKIGIGAVERDNIGSGSIFHGHLAASIVTADNIQTGSINTGHIKDGAVGIDALATGSVGKKQLHVHIVQNNTDAHGGLNYAAGRLSVGYRKQVHVRSDGSNISGSSPTKGFFATNAVPTPFTTASLAVQPSSGSLMVYLNGVLLHGQHATAKSADIQDASLADYRILTASNAHKVLLHPDLALDADDILTITYLSGTLS